LTPAFLLFVAGFAPSIAFNIQLEDRRVMDEPAEGLVAVPATPHRSPAQHKR
jgi:hypothetical protein